MDVGISNLVVQRKRGRRRAVVDVIQKESRIE
jgi:hypothetical protein